MKSALQPSDILTIKSELSLPELPAKVEVLTPAPIGVQRTYGFVAVDSAEDIEFEVLKNSGLQQIDAGEFPLQMFQAASRTGKVQQAFRFWKSGFELGLDVRRIRPDVKVVVTEAVTISDKNIFLNTKLQYDIRKAGVFDLNVSIPDGYEVESVQGKGIKRWKEQERNTGRQLRIAFVNKLKGEYTLRLALRMMREFEQETPVPPIIPLGVTDYHARARLAIATLGV